MTATAVYASLTNVTTKEERVPLSKQQQAAVQLAARPLQPGDRHAFIEAVVKELSGCDEPGDGEVHRTIRKVQPQFFDPPLMRGSPLPAPPR